MTNLRTMRQILVLIVLGMMAAAKLEGQTMTQTLRGSVVDADSRQSLVGATIALTGTSLGTVTDNDGIFQIASVPVGRYRLQVSYVGYTTLVLPEIVVVSGKELVLPIELVEAPEELSAVVVSAPRSEAKTYCPTVKTLTVEETLRFPATFYDPARMAMNFAGVTNDNDQANGVSIRGNSPNGLSWRLEGIEIVNPNHTSNAGTFSDKPTLNGGGVNILSAQLLAASDFYTGAFPAEFGNALAGVMDMKLRTGNNQHSEFTAQAGLIGLDVAAEGPFSKKRGGASYLVNYRYSTIGLLDALGVELGDEAITFQDLSFNLVFPQKNGGRITVFGMGGQSANIFRGTADSTLWETEKDRYDIDFNSKMGAAGITFTNPIGSNSVYHSTLGVSSLETDWQKEDVTATPMGSVFEKYTIGQTKLMWNNQWKIRLSPTVRLLTGFENSLQINDSNEEEMPFQNYLTPHYHFELLLLRAYMAAQGQWGAKWTYNIGVHYQWGNFYYKNKPPHQRYNYSTEPRVSLTYHINANHSISALYGAHSQVIPVTMPPITGFMRSNQWGLDYNWRVGDNTTVFVEAYYQRLFYIPVESASSAVAGINQLEYSPYVNYKTLDGKGRNYGLELSIRRYMSSGWYYLANLTLFQSKYTPADGIERDTRYNSNYIANVVGGYEWGKQRSEKSDRTFGINLRVYAAGGYRESPINTTESEALGYTVYDDNVLYSIQQPAYFRTDFRAYIKWNKTRRSSSLALDIQNLTNAENVAYNYYDFFLRRVETKYQLGLIPLLSYRLEF